MIISKFIKNVRNELVKSKKIINVKNILMNYDGKDLDLNNYSIEKNKYCRNVLYRDELFEVLVLAWDKNVESPVHDHPKNGCYLKILKGELKETKFKKNGNIEDNYIKDNGISYIDNTIGIHKIKAIDYTFSIHVYSPPNYYK